MAVAALILVIGVLMFANAIVDAVAQRVRAVRG
jgi:hypothetical protein